MLDQTQTESKHQQLMNEAYDRWENGMSKEDFLDQLSPQERFAVTTGNLNYQVENGGFQQWWGNDYATPETVSYLRRQLGRMEHPAARCVATLLEEFTRLTEGLSEQDWSDTHCTNRWGDFVEDGAWEEMNEALSALDDRYYALNDQLMSAIEDRLRNWG